jgi:pyruvate, water dikinase
MTAQRFPFPDELETVPGTEGWEEMYPYHLVPSVTTRAHDKAQFWFADTLHYGKAIYPFGSIITEAAWMGLSQNASRIFSFPFSLGMDVRIINGYTYATSIPIADPAEIDRRMALFQERTRHYYTNWDEIYGQWTAKVRVLIDTMEGLTFPLLGEFDDPAVVLSARGRSGGYDLATNFRKLCDLLFLLHQYHFEMLNIGYATYGIFFQFCKQAFPEIEEQNISRMVAGFEVVAFRPDEELRKLARMAVSYGVETELSKGDTAPEIMATLKQSEKGRLWLEAFEAARYPWFHYTTGTGFYHDDKVWNNDLLLPLQNIRRYVQKLKGNESLDRPIAQLHQDRDRLAEGYSKLLDGDMRQQFQDLLNLSRLVFPYLEEHTFFIEHWGQAIFWNKARELGAAMHHLGLIDAVNDVFCLNRFEIDQALADATQAWAVGVKPRAGDKWRLLVAKRKPILEIFKSKAPNSALGIPPSEVTDPVFTMLYGITSERIASWLAAGNSEGKNNRTISGLAGSPGTATGTARLVMSEADLDRVQHGDIIVCRVTSPAWASVFQVASGVISDSGGMMSHAAIVCREYGIPAVVGTGSATQQLEDGQQVRLDGSSGKVTVL